MNYYQIRSLSTPFNPIFLPRSTILIFRQKLPSTSLIWQLLNVSHGFQTKKRKLHELLNLENKSYRHASNHSHQIRDEYAFSTTGTHLSQIRDDQNQCHSIPPKVVEPTPSHASPKPTSSSSIPSFLLVFWIISQNYKRPLSWKPVIWTWYP